MGKIKKNSVAKGKGQVKRNPSPSGCMNFSFMYFDSDDHLVSPKSFKDGYVFHLMQRLKGLSTWTVTEFTNNTSKSLRAHRHDWDKTCRPAGFAHLNAQLQEYEGWQFALSSNEYGRVHGIIIDSTFFVIWLDQSHNLYPS